MNKDGFPSLEQLLQGLIEKKQQLTENKAIKKEDTTDTKGGIVVTGTRDGDRYNNDPAVALFVASRKSMRQIARELNVDVSTVSRRVKKWAEQSAELRGDLATAREVELARLDEMLAEVDSWNGVYIREKLQILDRKYRLLGFSSSSPQVVVGIGIQQGQQGLRSPRVVDSVADHISDDSA